MTPEEQKRIREAIRYIHADEEEGGSYDKGMRILCELAGIELAPHPFMIAISLESLLKEE